MMRLHAFTDKTAKLRMDGVPSIFWKYDGDKIIEMTRPEKLEKLEQIALRKSRKIKSWEYAIGAAVIVGGLIARHIW